LTRPIFSGKFGTGENYFRKKGRIILLKSKALCCEGVRAYRFTKYSHRKERVDMERERQMIEPLKKEGIEK
jgi:hypothetical protein